MNYYERYCGDYARDTGHLSLQEHGAYTVMLDTYYATETPLPADYKALYRICRAMSSKEQEAVRKVADEFFRVAADGLRHNGRADRTIEKALKRINAAKGNGSLGGRPPKEPSGLSEENPTGLEQEPSGHIGTASSTSPQVPEKSKTLSGKPDLRPLATEILNFLNSKTGRAYEPVDANLDLIVARLKEFPADDLRAVVAKKCREWKGGEMDLYLRPATLFNKTKFAQYQGELSQVPHE